MAATLDFLREAGVVVTLAAPDTLAASGRLTDDVRRYIRAHKPELLRELAAANDDAEPFPAELRQLVALAAVLEGWGDQLEEALATMQRDLASGVASGELVETMRKYLALHHAEAWAERQAIQDEPPA